MPDKIFISYRRDDAAGDARGIRDALAAKFGRGNVFMDVDNLLAGQRFDVELAKALDTCEVLIAVTGRHWMDLLKAKIASGERDYVRAEIAAALERGIVVIPVRVGQEGRMPTLPREDELPEDIRALVLHQKHDVAHERFRRDTADLIAAIQGLRRVDSQPMPWGKIAAAILVVVVLGGAVLAYQWVPWRAEQNLASDPEPVREKSLRERIKGATERIRTAVEKTKERWAEEDEAKREAERERQRLATPKDRASDEDRKAIVWRPGKVFRDCPNCPEMVVVPAGSFTMGSPEREQGRYDDEGPMHNVTIKRPFAMGKYEVTFVEWEACVVGGGCSGNPRPGDFGWGKGRRPVVNLAWYDAQEYISWLSRETGESYRLPSEAEWEYAGRAGTTTRYAFGDTLAKNQAQYNADRTAEVGSFPPNKFGLYEMHGNVWEWCEDTWHPNYQDAPDDGSVWLGGDRSLRVLRSGSHVITSTLPINLRSATRWGRPAVRRAGNFGFRVAKALD